MKVKIDGAVHDCISARRTQTEVILTVAGLDEKEYDSHFSGCHIVENAEVIDGAWEYDAFAEPSQTDRIEAQVTYTAMMTDTLLEV